MVLAEPIQVTVLVAKAFEELGIRYFVGGSLASSLHGIPRATQDVDLVAAIEQPHVVPLVARLGHSFYIDGDMISDAIRRRRAFNIIHLETMLKVDIFVAGASDDARRELNRAEPTAIEEEELLVASAEDIVLEKLRWYQLGNRVSERQWTDVLGVLKVQRARLDWRYLDRWSRELGVRDLLDRAKVEVGAGQGSS